MIGGKDTAYGRIERCRAFNEKLKELKGASPRSFPYEMLLIEENGHTGLPDRDYLAKMLEYSRSVTCQELTWEMTDSVVHDFFGCYVMSLQNKKKSALVSTATDSP